MSDVYFIQVFETEIYRLLINKLLQKQIKPKSNTNLDIRILNGIHSYLNEMAPCLRSTDMMILQTRACIVNYYWIYSTEGEGCEQV